MRPRIRQKESASRQTPRRRKPGSNSRSRVHPSPGAAPSRHAGVRLFTRGGPRGSWRRAYRPPPLCPRHLIDTTARPFLPHPRHRNRPLRSRIRTHADPIRASIEEANLLSPAREKSSDFAQGPKVRRLAAGGRWIRTFGPSVQTMLLDTADPLAGRAGRPRRETAPRWDFGYTFVAILMAIACAFFPGMP
jgi:hypothetical protein